jgi:hypothetical protein
MAQRSFHLFSDEIFRTSGIQHYLDAAAEIQGFIKNLKLYGSEHNVVSGDSAPMTAMTSVFGLETCLYVLRLNEDIYVQGILVDESEPRVQEVGEAMKRHELRKLLVWRGVKPAELATLADLLSQKPGEVVRDGGFVERLQARGVQHIDVRVTRQASEAAGEVADDGSRRTAWQLGLEKAGIDLREFLDYMRFRPTRGRLMTRELRLAVPMLSDAQAVAELVLDMAQVQDDPDNVDSGQTVMAMRRVESVLLMHSSMTPEEITALLQQAARLFDDELRLQLLSDYLHDAARGRPWMNLEVFDFTPNERFLVLQQRVNARDRLDELQGLRLVLQKMMPSLRS